MSRKVSLITKIVRRMVIARNTNIGSFKTSIFHPHHFKNIYLTTQDNIKIGCWIIEPKGRSLLKNRKYIIMLHGNGSNRIGFASIFGVKHIVDRGYTAIIPDYREYGDSEGTFWCDTVNYDIEAVVDYVYEKFNSKVTILGYSLGGGVALEYVNYVKLNGFPVKYNKIILVSTFSSLIDVVKEQFLWKIAKMCFYRAEGKLVEEFNYDSCENIKWLDRNDVIIFHGKKDNLISCKHAFKLVKAVGCEYFITETDNHFSIMFNYIVWNTIDEFLGNDQQDED